MVTCPQCGRRIKVLRNKFGDAIYQRHKMARAWSKGRASAETMEDLKPGHNAGACYTFELDCPMSGQPVE